MGKEERSVISGSRTATAAEWNDLLQGRVRRPRRLTRSSEVANRIGAALTAAKPIPPRSRPLAVRRQPFGASEAPSRDGRSGRCSRPGASPDNPVIGLGLPELADRLDLGHHFAIPQPRGIHIGDRILGDALLLLVDIIDARPVGEPTIIAPRFSVVGSWIWKKNSVMFR